MSEISGTLGFLLFAAPLLCVLTVEALGVSAFSAAPLRSVLIEQLSGRSFSVPVFATISLWQEVFDPDNLAYVSTGIPPSAAISLPHPKAVFVPKYLRIDTLSANIVDALLASAALPFGIVPAVEGAVDGGLADNLPIYPLIALVPCEEILAIRTGPEPLDRLSLTASWAGIDRILRLLRYDGPSAHQAHENPRWITDPQSGREIGRAPAEPLREPPYLPRISCLTREAPPLPAWKDFFCATMNFRAAFAKAEFDRGYARAQRWLGEREARAPFDSQEAQLAQTAAEPLQSVPPPTTGAA